MEHYKRVELLSSEFRINIWRNLTKMLRIIPFSGFAIVRHTPCTKAFLWPKTSTIEESYVVASVYTIDILMCFSMKKYWPLILSGCSNRKFKFTFSFSFRSHSNWILNGWSWSRRKWKKTFIHISEKKRTGNDSARLTHSTLDCIHNACH